MSNIYDVALGRNRRLTTDDLPGAGSGGGGGGDATAANQVIGNTTLNNILTMDTTIAGRIGGTDESAPASDTASSGLNGRLQRLAQRLTELLARIPAAFSRTTMLSAQTTTGAGNAVADNGRPPSFSASVTGTGAVSATVRIEGRNADNGVWFTMATITLSGTTSAADGFGSLVRYMEYRAVLAAVSGTGAAVSVTMGS